MKSYYPLLLVILVMLFVAVSCKFDDEHYTTQQSQRKTSLHQLPEKIVFAFDRFHEHISRIKDKIDPNTLGAMDYGNAIVKQNEDGSTSYTIPLFRVSEELEDSRFPEDSIALTSDQTSTSYQFDNLVIKQMKNGRLWGHLIRYNPTPSWYTSQPTNTKDLTTFSGVMTIFNVHAKQIASIVMENGNEINTIETPPENNDEEQPNATPTFTISSPHIRRVDNCEVVCTHTTRTVSYKWTKSKRGTNESIRLGEVVVTISCRKVYTREYYFADDEDNDHLDYDDECDNFEDIFDDYYDDFEDDKDDWYDYYNKNRINTTPRVPTCKTNEEKNAYGKCVPKCLAGYTRNAYGNCVRICPEGQIKDKNGNCVKKCTGRQQVLNANGACVQRPCKDDEEKNITTGECVDKPCAGDPVLEPEVARQKVSGTLGGMYGCTRYGSGCNGKKGRTKPHYGLDLEANYGDPIYAMHDGFIYSAKYDAGGGGYYIRIQSTVNGETFIHEYFHLQDENREKPNTDGTLNYVKAGDIIGYLGDSGNLKGAIAEETAVSHVHIKIKKHDGSNKWNYDANFNVDDPRDYITTEIEDDGEVEDECD